MVREDDTASGPAKQKNTALRPTTLDLHAVEIEAESPAAPADSAVASAEGEMPADIPHATHMPQGGETPQEPAASATGKESLSEEAGAAPSAIEAETVVPEVQPEPKLDVFDEPRDGIAVESETPEATMDADRPGSAPRAAEPEPQPAPGLDVFDTPPPAPSRLPIALGALGGGIVGAVLVLAALSFGLVPVGRSDDGLSPRLAAAEQDIASGKAATDQALTRATAAEDAAKSARDAANEALNLAGDAQKAAATSGTASAPEAPPPDIGPLTDRLVKAEADIASLHAALDQAAKSQTEAIAPVSDQASAASAAALKAESDLRETQKQVAALAASTSAASNKAAAYAVALGQVAEAVRDGKPFGAELKTATGIGGNAGALAPLAALADTGVPSTATLAASFDALKPQIVAAMEPKPAAPAADAGVMDRLMSGLGRVVVVTREGDGSPDDPALPAQKVSDDLHRGDLAGAIAAFKALPPAGQQAGAAWLAEASSALDALDVIKAETDAALQKFSGQ